MSTTVDLVQVIKNELKSARMTYADLARALGMAESSVKRMLARGDMPLSRVDAICRALKMDFADLARRVADAQPLLKELSAEQEREGYTLLLGMRNWEFTQFTQLRRSEGGQAAKQR